MAEDPAPDGTASDDTAPENTAAGDTVAGDAAPVDPALDDTAAAGESTVGELWTIGHWTCPEATFLHTLSGGDVELLVDVRSLPGSRRSPQFSREGMPQWLGEAGVDYLHLPDLGGRRKAQRDVDPQVNAGWRNPSFKHYADYTLTPGYEEGLDRLTALALERRVAIMCGEPVPWRCHRLLIANTLTARGWTVWHLMTNATPRRHALGQWGATPRVDARGVVTYPDDAGGDA